MIGGIVAGIIILAIAGVLIAYFWRQRARATENTLKLTARMSGLEESEVIIETWLFMYVSVFYAFLNSICLPPFKNKLVPL